MANSTTIKVFPATRRTTNHPESRQLSEENYVRIIQSLSGSCNGSFIWKSNNETSISALEYDVFVGGYYHHIKYTDIPTGLQNVWLCIDLTADKELVVNETEPNYELIWEDNEVLAYSHDFNLLVIKDGQINTEAFIENATKCFFIAPSLNSDGTPYQPLPYLRTKLWLVSDFDYAIKICTDDINNQWTFIGSVYK